ncbi:MAG TPA: AraC family transcriptional regulator [Gemmatimonadaceae bacterium]|nr:AraC family transcriptional regulator [Gemmatimonadaceae bacterium]
MDPLSDVIRGIRLNGAHFYRVEAAPPWSVSTVESRELEPRVLPESQHLISFHILLRGECWAGLDGHDQVRMSAGDVIMFPHGDAHVMSSHEWAQVRDVDSLLTEPRRFSETVYLGAEHARNTAFVCGFLGCDLRPFNPLLAALPRRLHAPGIAAGWLAPLSNQVVPESRAGRVGKDTMVTRMAELLFIEAVRQHVEGREEQTGWLAGLVDPVVGPALTRMHETPAHAWTLPKLAREGATSRSVLADRFTRTLGVSPMQYLKRWRLQLAADELVRGSAKVSAIATRIGYDSEAAFSRAFKQETGVSPAAWRRRRTRPTQTSQTSRPAVAAR